jgi:hypothetical protein
LDDTCDVSFDLDDDAYGNAKLETSESPVIHHIKLKKSLLTDPELRKSEAETDAIIFGLEVSENDVASLSFLHELGHLVLQHYEVSESDIYTREGKLTVLGEQQEDEAYVFARAQFVAIREFVRVLATMYRNEAIYSRKTCGACGVEEGQIHRDFCDMEECPICGDQFFACDCNVDEKLQNRIPFIGFPLICDYCGKLWPEFFKDDEWKSVLPRIHWGKLLCLDCWQYIKNLIRGTALMGYLNLDEREHFRIIKRRLRARGLKPEMSADDNRHTEWEIHGPHQDMNHHVYVGPAYEKDPDDSLNVAIYPRAVYDIGDLDWWRVTAEYRIPVVK